MCTLPTTCLLCVGCVPIGSISQPRFTLSPPLQTQAVERVMSECGWEGQRLLSEFPGLSSLCPFAVFTWHILCALSKAAG